MNGPVAVVGGGWAGLAAAVTLAQHRVPVTLYESARQIGGRARCVAFREHKVDNGQHLFLGAYRATLAVLHTIGIDPDAAFLRQPLSLTSLRPGGSSVLLKSPRLPAPLHLLFALLNAKGLSLQDRFRAMQFGLKLKLGRLAPSEDISLHTLLQQHRQTPTLCEALWEPLCLAIMNTPPDEASAEIFVQVLEDAFLYRRQDADLLIARTDLSRLLADPAMDFIERHHGHVHLGTRITAVVPRDTYITTVHTDDAAFDHSHTILCVPPYAAGRLLPDDHRVSGLRNLLAQFEYAPICTVYLQYPSHTQLPSPMLGMLDTIGQWVFDRRVCGQAGLIAVIISAHGAHMQWNNARLTTQIRTELARLFPHWPEPLAEFVLREKRATFHCRHGINASRPMHRTPLPGIWLAGDYTRNGYPATLEGAVRSGVQCAHQIIETLKQKEKL